MDDIKTLFIATKTAKAVQQSAYDIGKLNAAADGNILSESKNENNIHEKYAPANFTGHAEIEYVGAKTYVKETNGTKKLETAEPSRIVVRGNNLMTPFIRGITISNSNGSESMDDKAATTDFIPIRLDGGYYNMSGVSTNINSYIAAYDINKNFIRRTGASKGPMSFVNKSSFQSGTSQSDGEVAYVRIKTYLLGAEPMEYLDEALASKYMLNHGAIGEYSEYKEPEIIDITNIARAAFPNGMKSAGDAFDEINLKTKKAITRCGNIDLGTLEWDYDETNVRFYANRPTDMANADEMLNVICADYSADAKAIDADDRTDLVVAASGGIIYIRDAAYTDAETFAEALAGKEMYYQLATISETEIQTEIKNKFTMETMGSFVFENSIEFNDAYEVPSCVVWTTKESINTKLSGKVAITQGTANTGKIMAVNQYGNVAPKTILVTCTQDEYDAMESHDPDVYYFITEGA